MRSLGAAGGCKWLVKVFSQYIDGSGEIVKNDCSVICKIAANYSKIQDNVKAAGVCGSSSMV